MNFPEAQTKVKCNRCKHVHNFGDRPSKLSKGSVWSDMVCPKCECKVYVDVPVKTKP